MLRLTDKEEGQERTPLDGCTFQVWLPAPGHAEFVVPLARFDAAVGREWTALQRCQVCSLLCQHSRDHPNQWYDVWPSLYMLRGGRLLA